MVLNGAVLARRIHRLKHKQQGPAVLRVEHVLLFRKPLGAASEKFRPRTKSLCAKPS